MSQTDPIAVIALLVSLIALVISVGQLLQSIFGTAEGFRRTNKEIIGLFAQTQDRVFHLTELRYETRFSTPHFTFQHVVDENSLLFEIKDDLGSGGSMPSLPTRHALAVGIGGSRIDDLNRLIRSSSRISKLQRFLNILGRSSASSAVQPVLPGSRAYAASWLILLEQLYEDDKKFNQRTDKINYIYMRSGVKGGRIGPDRREIRFPALESHVRSWDLLPPDVVRPLASVSLGDLLTLCFRLRITVQDFRLREFSADGYGHNFSSLQLQGLGMVVQYRYDKTNDNTDPVYHGNTKFVPCEDADKLAFGMIPKYSLLGIERDWPLVTGQHGQSFTDAMRTHFEQLGVSESALRKVSSNKDKDKNDVWQAFGDALLLLAPFMHIDGLGIVKYQPPIPLQWFESLLWIREGRITLRHRLNEMLPQLKEKSSLPTNLPPQIKQFESSQLLWVGAVFNFLESRYRDQFRSIPGFMPLIGKNASDKRAQDYLDQLRSIYTDADKFLATLFNQQDCIPTYKYLVAAHHEMAIDVHASVKQEIRDDRTNEQKRNEHKAAANFRDDTGSPGVWRWKTEIVHRYVDHAMENMTIIKSYREKTKTLMDPSGRTPANLSDEQIRDGWYTMMLRGCVWGITHHPIWLPNMPYPSRYWKDNTLVLIA